MLFASGFQWQWRKKATCMRTRAGRPEACAEYLFHSGAPHFVPLAHSETVSPSFLIMPQCTPCDELGGQILQGFPFWSWVVTIFGPRRWSDKRKGTDCETQSVCHDFFAFFGPISGPPCRFMVGSSLLLAACQPVWRTVGSHKAAFTLRWQQKGCPHATCSLWEAESTDTSRCSRTSLCVLSAVRKALFTGVLLRAPAMQCSTRMMAGQGTSS